jgi:hypothetical protein
MNIKSNGREPEGSPADIARDEALFFQIFRKRRRALPIRRSTSSMRRVDTRKKLLKDIFI